MLQFFQNVKIYLMSLSFGHHHDGDVGGAKDYEAHDDSSSKGHHVGLFKGHK